MTETLMDCERKRDALIDSLKELGDFRRGTITANYRKCGKPNCARTQEGREHYWNVAKACFGQNMEKLDLWTENRRSELDEGRVQDVVDAIKLLTSLPGCDKEVCEREIGYFKKNTKRMRYADFRSRGLFVGSGVVEAGCRTIIGQRLKQSGMHWTVKGANSIIALRCSLLSNRWEDFWEHRACA